MTGLQQFEPTTPVPAPRQELAPTATGAQAVATIQAKYTLAAHFPRDALQFRSELLHECQRSGFAAAARWRKPVGRDRIEGWTIRFVETAARLFRNLDLTSRVLYDDASKIVIECAVTDLQSNTSWTQELTVLKTVERRITNNTHEILSTRLNSYGDTLYIVRANDDDVRNKVGSAVSKTLRTLALRVLPADIIDEALGVVRDTLESAVKMDPGAERKKIADAFAALGVSPADLAAYLGHALQQTTPAEIVELRGIHQLVKSGEAKWSDIAKPSETKADDVPQTKTERVKDVLKARKGESNQE